MILWHDVAFHLCAVVCCVGKLGIAFELRSDLLVFAEVRAASPGFSGCRDRSQNTGNRVTRSTLEAERVHPDSDFDV